MGLDIFSSDEVKNFHIGYIGFTNMRAYFVLHYGDELYDKYMDIVKNAMILSWGGDDVEDEESFYDEMGDLNILLCHSDCDGELSSDECKILKDVLFIDKDKIKNHDSYENNPEYADRMISLMHEFKELIEYCAEHDDVKLIFG